MNIVWVWLIILGSAVVICAAAALVARWVSWMVHEKAFSRMVGLALVVLSALLGAATLLFVHSRFLVP